MNLIPVSFFPAHAGISLNSTCIPSPHEALAFAGDADLRLTR
jgi:hypothetical protein